MTLRLKGYAEASSLVFLLSLALSACASTASEATVPGVSGHTIRLGILTALSGPVADPAGKPYTRGIETFFDAISAQGGIDGYQVQLIVEDTLYDPQREVVEYNQIHNQVLMIAGSLGTEPSVAISHLALFDHTLVSVGT
ncbi:MAG TPA: ABC transporter substrate-binding protein, partial [Ktedonobacteraceae bacterium]